MPHVSLDEASSIWRDPAKIVDVEGSKEFDSSGKFVADGGFRLIKAVKYRVP